MKVTIAVVLAYLVGCICCGYYLVRWRSASDIREFGSGSAGGRNVGRRLGRGGFLLTVLGDGLKGVFTVVLAAVAGLGAAALGAVAVAVVVGHVWPVQLRGRGGRGVATAVGVLVALLAGRWWTAASLASTVAALMAIVLWTHRAHLARRRRRASTVSPA